MMVLPIVTEQTTDGRPSFMQDATPDDIRERFPNSLAEGSRILSERFRLAPKERP